VAQTGPCSPTCDAASNKIRVPSVAVIKDSFSPFYLRLNINVDGFIKLFLRGKNKWCSNEIGSWSLSPL